MIPKTKIFLKADSSSDLAYIASLKNAPNYSSFLVYEQTKGRGSRGKSWLSPKGNLYFSVLLYPNKRQSSWSQLSIVSCLALKAATLRIFKKSNLDFKFKWPNDLMLNEKKVGGVLIETIPDNNSVIIGFGLNLISNPKIYETNWPSTNISCSSIENYKPILIAKSILLELKFFINKWENFNFKIILNEWKKNLMFLGKEIHSIDLNKKLSGIFQDVGLHGQMYLKQSNNEIIEIMAGTFILSEKKCF